MLLAAAALSTALIFPAPGLAIITVPLTMLMVSALSPADIPQGAALNQQAIQVMENIVHGKQRSLVSVMRG